MVEGREKQKQMLLTSFFFTMTFFCSTLMAKYSQVSLCLASRTCKQRRGEPVRIQANEDAVKEKQPAGGAKAHKLPYLPEASFANDL